jgi:hypothetical protein
MKHAEGKTFSQLCSEYLVPAYLRPPIPGSVEEFLAKYEADKERRLNPPPPEPPKPPLQVVPPPSFALEYYPQALRYLLERSFNKKVADHFELSCVPAGCGMFSNRILIPVRFEGRLIGYQGRDFTGKAERKYLFPMPFQVGDRVQVISTGRTGHIVDDMRYPTVTAYINDQKSAYNVGELKNLTTAEQKRNFANYLYNWDNATQFLRELGGGPLILVEGVTDCWRMWLAGYKNVVATFGKSLKDNQRRLLLQSPEITSIIFFWDGDALAKAYDYARNCIVYPLRKRVYVAELPEDEQPDTCPDIHGALSRLQDVETFNTTEFALKQAIKALEKRRAA